MKRIATLILVALVTLAAGCVTTLTLQDCDDLRLREQNTMVGDSLRPILLNSAELMRAQRMEYPAMLKDAGVGGTAIVTIFIDEEGIVQDQNIKESSGHARLDAVALKVAMVGRFCPAKKHGQTVAVWIELSMSFESFPTRR